ncbi:hypothetical protein C8R45DRAFT_1104722 [Mycena sanguinolenta]|nr:hypothetical protein C8R45DRAFT_1104722 [Mycena sanguinolenta]
MGGAHGVERYREGLCEGVDGSVSQGSHDERFFSLSPRPGPLADRGRCGYEHRLRAAHTQHPPHEDEDEQRSEERQREAEKEDGYFGDWAAFWEEVGTGVSTDYLLLGVPVPVLIANPNRRSLRARLVFSWAFNRVGHVCHPLPRRARRICSFGGQLLQIPLGPTGSLYSLPWPFKSLRTAQHGVRRGDDPATVELKVNECTPRCR